MITTIIIELFKELLAIQEMNRSFKLVVIMQALGISYLILEDCFRIAEHEIQGKTMNRL